MRLLSIIKTIWGPSHEWRECVKDGRLVMRRKINGKWQYREPTVEEERQACEWRAFQL